MYGRNKQNIERILAELLVSAGLTRLLRATRPGSGKRVPRWAARVVRLLPRGVLERLRSGDLTHLRDQLSPVVAEMVYYGHWYCAKMDALLAFIRETQQPVTGEVTMSLYKGNIRISSRTSPNSLYNAEIASMEKGGDYNQNDAEGFLRIMGLPARVQGSVRPREY